MRSGAGGSLLAVMMIFATGIGRVMGIMVEVITVAIVVVVMRFSVLGRIGAAGLITVSVVLMTVCEFAEELLIATTQAHPLALLRLSHLFLLPFPQVTAQNRFVAVRALASPQLQSLAVFQFLHLARKVHPRLFAGIRPAVGQS